jgi:hypothetical protein
MRSTQGHCRTGRAGGQLPPGIERRQRAVRQEARHGHADEGLDDVPDQVNQGNLVSDELQREQHQASANDPGALNDRQVAGQDDPAGPRDQSQGRNGAVDIEARGKTDSHQEGGDVFGGGEHKAF